jgi:hypothetical protein
MKFTTYNFYIRKEKRIFYIRKDEGSNKTAKSNYLELLGIYPDIFAHI